MKIITIRYNRTISMRQFNWRSGFEASGGRLSLISVSNVLPSGIDTRNFKLSLGLNLMICVALSELMLMNFVIVGLLTSDILHTKVADTVFGLFE